MHDDQCVYSGPADVDKTAGEDFGFPQEANEVSWEWDV
jgi:hypothetical protein